MVLLMPLRMINILLLCPVRSGDLLFVLLALQYYFHFTDDSNAYDDV